MNILSKYLLNNIPREGTEGGAPPPPPPAPPPAAWYGDKLDAELVGHIQNRGWHNKPVNEVAIEAIKSHREAEKHMGVPAERLIRLPANMTDREAMKPVWQKLGAPTDAKDYDFSAVKNAAGEVINPKLADAIRGVAAELSLPKDAAPAVASAIIKHLDGLNAETTALSTEALNKERDALKANWGNNFEAHKVVAKAGAAKLGIDPEAVEALEKVVGYAKVMEAFRRVGALSGEDKFFDGGPNNPGTMTREQAVARKAELQRDAEWSKRYLAGGSAEGREMQALITIIAGGKK
jgi:hypothetical protein